MKFQFSFFVLFFVFPLAESQCPDGYIQGIMTDAGNCYYLSTYATDFATAERFCVQSVQGGHLVSILNAWENSDVTSIALIQNELFESYDSLWIGISNLFGSNFTWTSHELPVFSNWAPGEPWTNRSSCGTLQYRNQGLWATDNCIRPKDRPFICKITVNQNNSTTPKPVNTSPTVPLTTSSSPGSTTPSPCPIPSYQLWGDGNYCYKAYSTVNLLKTNYETICATLVSGGHLPSVHGILEQAMIKSLSSNFNNPDGTGIALGFTKESGGSWTWSDGSTSDYLNFINNTIAFANSTSGCARLIPASDAWNVVSCDTVAQSYVCQIPSIYNQGKK